MKAAVCNELIDDSEVRGTIMSLKGGNLDYEM
jgi:hypothetical protein